MRELLLILSIFTFSLSSCEQGFSEYTFQDIGLRIRIPDNYSIQDKVPQPSFLDSSGKQITDTTILKELEYDLWKGLLVVSSSDYLNTVSFNLARQTAKTGNFSQYYKFSTDMQEMMAKQQMTSYETVSSVLTADSIKIHKFMTNSINKNPVQFSGVYLAHVKEYFLIIKSDYVDKHFGENLEKAILTSKFY